MTPMSDPTTRSDAATRGYPLARALHTCGAAVLRVLPVIFVGCVIPPSLGVEQQDAGVNSPPSIVSVRSDQTELPEPGPVDFEVGSMSPLNLTLLDTDVNDKLYVRVFMDYTTKDPTAPRSTCTAASLGEATRTATCALQALCLTKDVGVPHLMQVMVFDRQPLEAGTPVFQAMPADGLSTDRTYQVNCRNPS